MTPRGRDVERDAGIAGDASAAHATSATHHAPPAGGWDAHVHVFDAGAPARAGHYRPAHRPLEAIEPLAASVGVSRFVLVQPSVYGTDHTVLLAALARTPGRHRGVAVIDAGTDDATLDALHGAGVRGARINRVSPVGHTGDPSEAFESLAPRLVARGWHLQWYAPAHELAAIATLHARPGAPVAVLDHLAGLAAGLDARDRAWQALARLADAGAWVKLSGWYRLGAAAPYDALLASIRRVGAGFGPRLVWGSDWPHTGHDAVATGGHAALLAPVVAALGEDAARRVLHGGRRLYD